MCCESQGASWDNDPGVCLGCAKKHERIELRIHQSALQLKGSHLRLAHKMPIQFMYDKSNALQDEKLGERNSPTGR